MKRFGYLSGLASFLLVVSCSQKIARGTKVKSYNPDSQSSAEGNALLDPGTGLPPQAPIGDNVLSIDGKTAEQIVYATMKDVGFAMIGKSKVRPDLTPADPLKSMSPQFLNSHTAQDLQSLMKRAVEASTHKQPTKEDLSLPYSFEGCEAAGNFGVFTIKPELSAGVEAAQDCGKLVTAPVFGKAVKFEFYITGSPGAMHQWIYVTTDISQRAAAFVSRRPLPKNVMVFMKPDLLASEFSAQIFPTWKNFGSRTAEVGKEMLGFSGGLYGDPKDLADVTWKWNDAQIKGKQLQVLGATAVVGLAVFVGAKVGIVAHASKLLQRTMSNPQSMWESFMIGKLIWDISSALIHSANSPGAIPNSEPLLETVDEGAAKDRLKQSLAVLAWASSGIDIGDMGPQADLLVRSAYRVVYEHKVLAAIISKIPRPRVTQMTASEYLSFKQISYSLMQSAWTQIDVEIAKTLGRSLPSRQRIDQLMSVKAVEIANAFQATRSAGSR
jgi:hypothetical protein